MNDDFLESIVNALFWKLVISKYKKKLILITADHTYRFYPGKYFTRVYQKIYLDETEKSEIELELKYLIMAMTGLPQEKVLIRFYLDDDILELK
jgi:hypothetical protein